MKRHVIPAVTLVALLLLAVAAPVQAKPIEREHYSGTDSFDFDDCGFVIHDEVTFKGTFMLKAPRTTGAPPYLFDNYESHEVLSANGRWLTIDHQGIYKDLRITHVSGTIYQFVAQEAGPAVRHPGQRRQRADPRPRRCCGRRSRSTPWATPTSTTTSSSRTAGSSWPTTAGTRRSTSTSASS